MTANLAETHGILGGPAQPVTIAKSDGAFVADGEMAWGALVVHGSLVEEAAGSIYTAERLSPYSTPMRAFIDAARVIKAVATLSV